MAILDQILSIMSVEDSISRDLRTVADREIVIAGKLNAIYGVNPLINWINTSCSQCGG